MALLNDPRIYVRRRGRITRGQARALAEGYSKFVIPMPQAPLDWSRVFGRPGPLLLEVGFGMGHALMDTARAHPDWNCLGVEVYQPGIGAVILRCETENVANLRLVEGDARVLAASGFENGLLSRVQVFFPDPWPKKRHHKRRLVEPGFVTLLAQRMAPHALLLAATDVKAYAEQMLSVFDAEPRLRNVAGPGSFASAGERAATRFETRGIALGHQVFDFEYERIAGVEP